MFDQRRGLRNGREKDIGKFRPPPQVLDVTEGFKLKFVRFESLDAQQDINNSAYSLTHGFRILVEHRLA